METVTVCEVGPRDGLQMARGRIDTAVKLRWIAALAAAGVPEIEVGSFVPARVIPSMADTAEVVREAVALPGVVVAALAPNLRGAQDAWHEFQQIGAEISADNRERLLSSLEREKQLVRAKRSQRRRKD